MEQIKKIKMAKHFRAKVFETEQTSTLSFSNLREDWNVYFGGNPLQMPFSVNIENEMVEFEVKFTYENSDDPDEGLVFRFKPKANRRRKLTRLIGKWTLVFLKGDGTPYRTFESRKLDWLSTDWEYPYQDEETYNTLLFLTKDDLFLDDNEVLGENDSLTVHLTFIHYHSEILEYPNAYRLEKEVAMETENALSRDMEFLLQGSLDTDFVIKTSDGVEFRAHKLILKSRVPMFRAMFETDMVERSTGEMETPVISSGAMRILLHYIYTGKLHQNWKQWRQLVNEVINGANLYGLNGLVQFYDMMLITLCNDVDAEDLLQVAKLHGLKQAEEDIGRWINGILAD